MSAVVDLAAWRRQRSAGVPVRADPAVDRLDRAVERLHGLVSSRLPRGGAAEARVETELLAIMGELAVGHIPEAADRAERLAAQLAR